MADSKSKTVDISQAGPYVSLPPRQAWMCQKVAQAFNLDTVFESNKEVEEYFIANLGRIDAFLTKLDTPPRLFFFYQSKTAGGKKEIFASTGEGIKLDGKCVYFVRDVATHKPVKTTVANDTDVLCGEVNSNILHSMVATLSEVYSPFLKSKEEWGAIKEDKTRKTFLDQTNKFADTIKRKITNLRGDVELYTPTAMADPIEQKPNAYEVACKEHKVVASFRGVVDGWCKDVYAYIKSTDGIDAAQIAASGGGASTAIVPLAVSGMDRKTAAAAAAAAAAHAAAAASFEPGPEVEIEYWSRRLLTLISITEQLKTKNNRVVTGVLKQRANVTLSEDSVRSDDSAPSEQERVKQLLEKWHDVNLMITDALNEAKDNVRFLENLRKVIEPLYTDAPAAISETMPALMNSMKMIHTLSRHYGTETRMTKLFCYITNQLIKRCKEDIGGGMENSQGLWSQEPADVIRKMTNAINLLKRYESEYRSTKKKLSEMPMGKQFNFDENLIFEKFTRFQRRLEKLIDMFSSIQQFKALEAKHIDGIDGPDSLIGDFNKLIDNFRFKQSAHDLLAFGNTIFERDFVEFTMNNSALENQIQEFMAVSIQNMTSIDKQLQFMSQFQSVLSREALREDLDHKYLMIFKAYRDDLIKTQAIYDRCYQNPPIPRNMPPYAGCIYWSRQLLRHITRPMKKFQAVPRVFHPKDSKKTVELHNTLARTLVTFEAKCLQNWQARAEKDKKGLRSNLVVIDPKTGQYRVQFSASVHNLMREAKHFQIMGYDLPNSAKIVLLLEEKLKGYYNQLNHALATYSRVTRMIQPVTNRLLAPHLADLDAHIAPACTIMTWTSMNIESFLHTLHTVLARFEYLVSQVNDIMENRIEKNLKILGNLSLLNLPAARTFSLREFVVLQKQHLETCATALSAKNLEIERAVNDLVEAVQSYPLGAGIAKVRDDQIADIKFHYQHELYHRLLQATKNSLHQLKKRVTSRVGGSSRFGSESALFEVNLNLAGSAVEVEPALADVQRELNGVARELLQATAKVFDWGMQMNLDQQQISTRSRQSFCTRLAADKNVALVLLLLTGAVESAKRAASDSLSKYGKFNWLWTRDPENDYAEFVETTNPILEDFIAKLHWFVSVENEIKRLPSIENLGSLNLKTDSLKAQLKHEIERWKYQYSEQLHLEAKGDMENVIETMAELKQRLSIEVKDIATLNFVMEALAELRDVQSEIDMRFQSIIERYSTLESDLAFGPSKDEMDQKSLLKQQWTDILQLAEGVTAKVNGLQHGFREELSKNIKIFKSNVKNFRADYERNGPGVEGIQPSEASHLLARFQSDFETLHHTQEVYRGGERLFGLPESQYPELVKTKKELADLDNLYRLYRDVLSTLDEYNNIAWADVIQNIDQMKETMSGFDRRAKALNKNIKKREACTVLTEKIKDFNQILDPLLIQLSKPAMKEERHWKRVSEITHTEFNLNKFSELKLKDVLAAKLHLFTDDILEVTESADRQRGIQLKLEKLLNKWRTQEFKFGSLKSAGMNKQERPDVILKGDSVQEIQELLDDSITQINQLKTLPQQHIKHFAAELVLWTNQLSSVSDTLEDWVRVQQLWMALEKVFLGGDIAKQMLADARVFASVDKEWTQRLMVKAKETRNVVECCLNEYIKNILPKMKDSLERCQKALDDYLDTKRGKFARFYFVDNDSLLTFLSHSQYLDEIQGCFPKITENNIDNVTHHGNSITAINTGQGDQSESVSFPPNRPVIAKGNIEDWLNQFIKEMMRTMKEKIRQAAIDSEPLTQPNMEKAMEKFINNNCAQVALLGLQFVWTRDTQEALHNSKTDRKSLADAHTRQKNYLMKMSDSTTQEIANKLERTKLETLITIQLHQVEILSYLVGRFAGKKVDPNDFDWLKRLRCYWDPQKDDCEVRIANHTETYCYEYLGVSERLVVTGLTDRCYISLSQAVKMHYGGSPMGPAGTGKTETVKDLGRAYGKLVIVFNCSNMDDTAKLASQFKGLCQSGSWGCFDEFNRIRLEVLSVVAQQVQAIMDARRTEATTMTFPGDNYQMSFDRRCGAFITMNPTYAGRQELPGNLKALFRGVAMMVPDRESIIRVKLSSVGFKAFRVLATKFHILYQLCEQQLTKQKHYDFGLRNILSVLRTAGLNLRKEIREFAAKADEQKKIDDAAPTPANLKQKQQTEEDKTRAMEERLIARTLRDMNLSKLVFDDVQLFLDLLRDLFRSPNKDLGKASYPAVEAAVRKVIEESKTPNLIYHTGWVDKIMQLYETSIVRHGLMIVGPAGGGKSTAIRVLSEALSIVNDDKARLERIENEKKAKIQAAKEGKKVSSNLDVKGSSSSSGGAGNESDVKDTKVGRVTLERMNPKAITEGDMFGKVDPVSHETTPGVFFQLWKKANVKESKNFTWIVCDGPVDTKWIENLNSVMDDTKTLTVGGRVPMTANVRLMFEIEDLRNASPATVSRAGIIYVSNRDLGHQPLVDAWLLSRRPEQRALLGELYSRYVIKANLLDFVRRYVTNVMRTSEAMLVNNLLVLLKGLLQESEDNAKTLPAPALERIFLYALCWSVGGLCEHKDRVAFSRELSRSAPRAAPDSKEVSPAFYPCKPDETLYDYYVDRKKDHTWAKWTVKEFDFNAKFKFSTCLVPTVDSVRAQALIRAVLHTRQEMMNLPVISHPVMIVGSSGTAKTTTVLQYVQSLLEENREKDNLILKKSVFSSATTPDLFYNSILNDPEIVRRGVKRALGPAPGKQMILFLDDLSMPEINEWDDQPTLELVRQLIEDEGFYLLEKGSNALKVIMQGMVYLGAMSHPTGGRNDIPSRLKRHFYTFNMTPPSDASIDNIYGSMLRGHLSPNPQLFSMWSSLTRGAVEIWNELKQNMLPTPSKFHYVYNMRDLSRIFQGILHAPLSVIRDPSTLVSLWRHECERVFCDKLVTEADKEWYQTTSARVLAKHFDPELVARQLGAAPGQDVGDIKSPRGGAYAAGEMNYFVDYLRGTTIEEETGNEIEAEKIYEQVTNLDDMRAIVEKANLEINKPGEALVLFHDALEHLMRIARIICMPRGSALLVGVGGSGRQSLARLAAKVAGHEVFQIRLTRVYRTIEFLNDIKNLFKKVGKDGKKITWIVTDFEIINEEFLEYINAVLTTGEVPGMFTKDGGERDMWTAELRGVAKKEDPNFRDTPDNLYRYFLDRIRDNLHVVLCFSPTNDKFAERARRFPGLISGCTVDWFLPWPEIALFDVATKFIASDVSRGWRVIGDAGIEAKLVKTIASVHNIVTAHCEEYFTQYRRRVYVTPKSYLAFIKQYKELYTRKLKENDDGENTRNAGLSKLDQAEDGVKALSVKLAQQTIELKKSEEETLAMLENLQKLTAQAEDEQKKADKIRDNCTQTAGLLKKNKDQADKDLEAALPFQTAALTAANDLNKRDLDNIKGLPNPPSLLKRIMDCVLVLRSLPLLPVRPITIKTGKTDHTMFMADSYDQYAKKMMASPTFREDLADFVKEQRDTINEETMELLEPYFAIPDFTEEGAAHIYGCAKGILVWVKSMAEYHRASLVVRPRLDDLKKKSSLHAAALKMQEAAEESANRAAAEVKGLNLQYQAKIAKKGQLEQEKKETLDKKAAAEHLINMLSDNKKRWAEDARSYATKKQCLVGDCALACAFVSYLGPFNHQFRRELMVNHFIKSCLSNGLPVSMELDLNMMLINKETIAVWNTQGLPKDDLSVQNGILVTQASRFPLLIDPQGQGVRWLKNCEASRFPVQPMWTPTININHPRLRDHLLHCMENGLSMLIDGIVKDVDPMLDPVLEKNFIARGRGFRVVMGENQEAPIDRANFKLILVTKLANPLFSPELCAKTTIVDFSVTESGLADQLLSAVIEKEKKDLEDKAREISEDVSRNMSEMAALDRQLLDRLSTSKGSLLEDQHLIQVLTATKTKHNESLTMLTKLKSNEQSIESQRNQYRAVAVRGSALFFVAVALSQVNPMYQTSLNQFGAWFEGALLNTPKPLKGHEPTPTERVAALCNTLTFDTYVNINRGLFEVDKLIFKLMMAMKIVQTMDSKTATAQLAAAAAALAAGGPAAQAAAAAAGGLDQKGGPLPLSGLPPGIGGGSDPLLTQEMVNLFLRGGAALNTETLPKGPTWLNPLYAGPAWANICQLSLSMQFFSDLRKNVIDNEAEWREWYVSAAPEAEPIPRIEERLQKHACGPFLRLLVVRSFREDRMRLAANRFIQVVLDARYTAPLPARLEDMLAPNCSNSRTPIIIMLTAGSNPTQELQQMAQRGVKVGQQQQSTKGLQTVSMGDRQDEAARACVEQCMAEGGWALLQNCHLGLGFMSILDEFIRKKHEEKGAVQEQFRLWITCEPHPDFPVSLLQMSVKMTMEPPRGMQAGLMRSYNSIFVDPEKLKVPRPEWKDLVYVVSFLHSVVIERRKYGAAGWCIPYEFSQDDLIASLTFLERFLQRTVEGSAPSYTTIQYMIGEVQYGGRITDPFDEELFKTYTKKWLTPDVVNDGKQAQYTLVNANKVSYKVPMKCNTLDEYIKFIKAEIPENDTPEIFGLHPNVDIQFGISETNYVLNSISDTMPKQSYIGGKGGKAQTREQKVKEIATSLLADMKELTLPNFKDEEIRDLLRKRPVLPPVSNTAAAGAKKGAVAPPVDNRSEVELVLGDAECKRLQKEGKWPVDASSIPLNIFLHHEITRLNAVINNVRNTLQSIILAINGEIITTPALLLALNSVFDAKPPRQWYIDAGGEEIAWANPSLGAWFKGLKDREAKLASWLTKRRPPTFWLTGFFNPTGFLTAMSQEVCRRRNLPLDNIVKAGRVVTGIQTNADGSPIDGCYLTGLSLEGCTWDHEHGRLKDYVDKKIFTPIPLLLVTPITAEDAKEQFKPADKWYNCPVYTKPKRGAAAFVFDVKLPFDPATKQSHWTLRGVALLASTD